MGPDGKNAMTEEKARDFADQQLSYAQTLATIFQISALVSLVIGGIPLALVALVCGAVALSKVRSAIRALGGKDGISARLTQQLVIGLAIAAVSIVVNAVYLYMMMPAFMEYLQTGDITVLTERLGTAASDAASSSSASSSVWD